MELEIEKELPPNEYVNRFEKRLISENELLIRLNILLPIGFKGLRKLGEFLKENNIPITTVWDRTIFIRDIIYEGKDPDKKFGYKLRVGRQTIVLELVKDLGQNKDDFTEIRGILKAIRDYILFYEEYRKVSYKKQEEKKRYLIPLERE